MTLSIIIVNWNSKAYLRECLRCLEKNTAAIDLETIVIDSASYDGCGEMLEKEFPGVVFIQSDENLGFAKANNQAFQSSQGEYILFLNPDTEVRETAIEKLLAGAESLPDAGIVGARLLNTDLTVQKTAVKRFPTILSEILDFGLLQKLFPSASLWGSKSLHSSDSTPSEVDAISGACMCMNRQHFIEFGQFPENYFMYSEDVELSYHSKLTGHKNYLIPDAVIVHHGGSSSSKSAISDFSNVMLLESRWRYFKKTRSNLYASLYRCAMCLTGALRLLTAACLLITTRFTGNHSRWRNAVKKWWKRIRWSLGLEKWSQNFG